MVMSSANKTRRIIPEFERLLLREADAITSMARQPTYSEIFGVSSSRGGSLSDLRSSKESDGRNEITRRAASWTLMPCRSASARKVPSKDRGNRTLKTPSPLNPITSCYLLCFQTRFRSHSARRFKPSRSCGGVRLLRSAARTPFNCSATVNLRRAIVFSPVSAP